MHRCIHQHDCVCTVYYLDSSGTADQRLRGAYASAQHSTLATPVCLLQIGLNFLSQKRTPRVQLLPAAHSGLALQTRPRKWVGQRLDLSVSAMRSSISSVRHSRAPSSAHARSAASIFIRGAQPDDSRLAEQTPAPETSRHPSWTQLFALRGRSPQTSVVGSMVVGKPDVAMPVVSMPQSTSSLPSRH